jgi:hypothetical protein
LGSRGALAQRVVQRRWWRTEQRIAGLVRFISEGDDSEYVRKTLKDLEAQAKTEKAAISALTQQAARPIQLPTPEDVTKCIRILEDVMAADPLAGREQLGRLFEGGRLMLQPQADGGYVAEGRIDLGALLRMRFAPTTVQPRQTSGGTEAPLAKGQDYTWSSDGCAGANRTVSTSDEPPIPLVILVPPPLDRRKHPSTWKRRVA